MRDLRQRDCHAVAGIKRQIVDMGEIEPLGGHRVRHHRDLLDARPIMSAAL
jgi:hypothetical protein